MNYVDEEIMVVKEFTFDAAHQLPDHPGKCKQMHGHTYRLQVGIKGPINSVGMVIDFGDMKDIVNELLERVDHKCLNEIEADEFPFLQPTAECMVLWFRDRLSQAVYRLTGQYAIRVVMIKLWETPTSYAEWRAFV